MTMPGFSAEASVGRPSRSYRATATGGPTGGGALVAPATISVCTDIGGCTTVETYAEAVGWGAAFGGIVGGAGGDLPGGLIGAVVGAVAGFIACAVDSDCHW